MGPMEGVDSSMFFAEGARRGLNFVFRPQYLVATGPRVKINAGESPELVTDGRETEELTPRSLLWNQSRTNQCSGTCLPALLWRPAPWLSDKRAQKRTG